MKNTSNDKYIKGIYRLEYSVVYEGGGDERKFTEPLTIEKPVGYTTMLKKFKAEGLYTPSANAQITEVQRLNWVTETLLTPVF